MTNIMYTDAVGEQHYNINYLIGKTTNLSYSLEKQKDIILKLGKNIITITSKECKRFDFRPQGEIINSSDFYNQEYLNELGRIWSKPIQCIIKDNPEYVIYFESVETGQIIIGITKEYKLYCLEYYNSSPESDGGFLHNLM